MSNFHKKNPDTFWEKPALKFIRKFSNLVRIFVPENFSQPPLRFRSVRFKSTKQMRVDSQLYLIRGIWSGQALRCAGRNLNIPISCSAVHSFDYLLLQTGFGFVYLLFREEGLLSSAHSATFSDGKWRVISVWRVWMDCLFRL